ncbi:flavin reductase family protein (plasmid) [Clostridium estertheticum]|uniref:flavin reductase family protein n=1 Tax=Clostridium estertheticum TaxID=238834 RepID=UPI001C0C16DA|nr:flavin reductase family protein [Clostridium estertheticum]MBU3217383.1 flavin reductase family protein [Clostridium estertheticum]WAG58159.1 flavin reductase family protein [Clostridium estertheticum]
MDKIKMGNKNYLYPNPIILVGTNVNGKPNYLNVSYCGIVNRIPAMISISLNRSHYTCTGIKQNKSFSINIPSVEMLEVTDYCGIVSGKDVDKSNIFNTFYGGLKDVPMIQECPINMECRVVHELDLGGTNIIIIGEVVQTYSEEKYLTNNIPDLKKINPILVSIYEFNYYNVGEKIGKAWDVGKNYGN